MVYCLNATSGAFVWSYKTVDSVESSPAVVGGLVYVGSDDHNVYCLNASTGAFVWSYTTGSEVGYSSPAVVGGLVYVGSLDDMVYCLNATSGAFVWSYKTGGMVFSSPAVVTGLVYVGSNDDNVYCLNASTGAFVWSYTTGGEVDSSPAVVNGVVYVGSEDGKVYAFGPSSAEHDVSIEGIIASKSVLGSGYSMGINVTAADLGSYTETLNLTAYANATIIGSENITLAAGISTTVTFTWNTTGLAYGNYTLSAYALLVLGETNTGNDNMTGGTVYVGIPGDINGDGIVDIYDGVIIAGAFNSQPGDHNWNPNADINGDGIVDIFDAVILAGNFNQRIP
jgi:outer membrane protein assembly factor BamB